MEGSAIAGIIVVVGIIVYFIWMWTKKDNTPLKKP